MRAVSQTLGGSGVGIGALVGASVDTSGKSVAPGVGSTLTESGDNHPQTGTDSGANHSEQCQPHLEQCQPHLEQCQTHWYSHYSSSAIHTHITLAHSLLQDAAHSRWASKWWRDRLNCRSLMLSCDAPRFSKSDTQVLLSVTGIP